MPQKLSTKYNSKCISLPSRFVRTLFDLLNQAAFSDIIKWNLAGTAFIISNTEDFCDEILPIYFKQICLTSFFSKLSLYRFDIDQIHDGDYICNHKFFLRDKKYILKNIKKTRRNFRNSKTNQDLNRTNFYDGINQGTVSACDDFLKIVQQSTSSRISALEAQIDDLIVQNQALQQYYAHQSNRKEALAMLFTSVLSKFEISGEDVPAILVDEFDLNLKRHSFESPDSYDHCHEEIDETNNCSTSSKLTTYNDKRLVPITNSPNESQISVPLNSNHDIFIEDNHIFEDGNYRVMKAECLDNGNIRKRIKTENYSL